MNKVVLEFTGIPGSGKTYTVSNITQFIHKANTNINIITRTDLYEFRKNTFKHDFFVFMKILLNIDYIKLLAISVINKGNLSYRIRRIQYIIKILLQQYTLFYHAKNNESNSIYLIDEGFLNIESVLFSRPLISKLDKITKKVLSEYKKHNMSLFLIFLNSNVELSYERIENRSTNWPSIVREKSKTVKINYLKDYVSIVEKQKELHKNEFIDVTDYDDFINYFPTKLINIFNSNM